MASALAAGMEQVREPNTMEIMQALDGLMAEVLDIKRDLTTRVKDLEVQLYGASQDVLT